MSDACTFISAEVYHYIDIKWNITHCISWEAYSGRQHSYWSNFGSKLLIMRATLFLHCKLLLSTLNYCEQIMTDIDDDSEARFRLYFNRRQQRRYASRSAYGHRLRPTARLMCEHYATPFKSQPWREIMRHSSLISRYTSRLQRWRGLDSLKQENHHSGP